MALPPLQKIWEVFLEASKTAEDLGTTLKTGGGSESSQSEYWDHSFRRTLLPCSENKCPLPEHLEA